MKEFFNSSRLKVLIVFSTISVVSAFFFQNCGKAGFDMKGATGTAVSELGSTEDIRFKDAPYPLDINVNQISYMSCPLAGDEANKQLTSDPLSVPYYTFRLGAFDNSTLPTKTSTNIAGISVNQKALDYLASRNKLDVADRRNYLMGSGKTINRKGVVALVSAYRTQEFVTFTALASVFTDVLSLGPVAFPISDMEIPKEGLPTKVNYFPLLEGPRRYLVSSLNFGMTELDANKLRSQMNSHYLLLGSAPAAMTDTPENIIVNLDSRDNDITKRIYGRAMQLTFKTRTQAQQPYLNSVTEFSLDPDGYTSGPVNPENISDEEEQNWSCFNLTIVRDVDRRYAMMGSTLLHKKEVQGVNIGGISSTLLADNAERKRVEKTMHTLYDADEPFNDLVHKACPPMEAALLDSSNGNYNKSVAEKYLIARRFLPSEFWEVNTAPGFECAVPKPTATLAGYKCYATGDIEAETYIQYPSTELDASPTPTCGPTGNECAAFVSFCIRKQ